MNVIDAPKTTTFQMRINSDIRSQLEDIYSRCGLSLTDAINVFFQQTINAEDLPFNVTARTREQNIDMLFSELEKGDTGEWVSEDDILKEFALCS